jgi:hypothetical protein
MPRPMASATLCANRCPYSCLRGHRWPLPPLCATPMASLTLCTRPPARLRERRLYPRLRLLSRLPRRPPEAGGGLPPKETRHSAKPNASFLPLVVPCRDRWLPLRFALDRCPSLTLAWPPMASSPARRGSEGQRAHGPRPPPPPARPPTAKPPPAPPACGGRRPSPQRKGTNCFAVCSFSSNSEPKPSSDGFRYALRSTDGLTPALRPPTA